MTKITTTITQRGQVTLPAQVRRMFGLKPRDKVEFTIEDGKVTVAPPKFTLESVFGSVKPKTRTQDFKKIEREAREEKVAREIRKLQKQ